MMETDFSSWCYINTKHKRVDFIPEQNIEELEYQSNLWARSFPNKKGVKMENLRLSNIGSYSVAKLNVTDDLMKMIPNVYNLHNTTKKNMKDLIVTESNGGMGGLTIPLATIFKKVNTIEIMPMHAEIIKHNVNEYKLSKKVTVIEADYMNVMHTLKQDIIVSDPPWGGKDYMKYAKLRLSLNNIDITCIINDLYTENKFKLYVLLVPYNFDIKLFIEKIKSSSIFIRKYSSLYVIFILNDQL